MKGVLGTNQSNRHFMVTPDKEPIGNKSGYIVNTIIKDNLSANYNGEKFNVCSTYIKEKKQQTKKKGLLFLFLQNTKDT